MTLWSILGIVSDSRAGSRVRGCVFGSFGSVKNVQHSHCTESSLDLQVSIPWSFRRWWGERAGLSKILKHCCIEARVTESHHLLHKVWWHHHASLSVHHNRNSSRQCGVLTLNRKLDKKSLRAPGSPCGVKKIQPSFIFSIVFHTVVAGLDSWSTATHLEHSSLVTKHAKSSKVA